MTQGDLMPQVKEIISNLFNVPEAQITENSSPETIENWDSMGQLTVILEIEQQFGVELSPEQTEKMTSVRAIVQTLEALQ